MLAAFAFMCHFYVYANIDVFYYTITCFRNYTAFGYKLFTILVDVVRGWFDRRVFFRTVAFIYVLNYSLANPPPQNFIQWRITETDGLKCVVCRITSSGSQKLFVTYTVGHS